MAKKRILIADDEEKMRHLLEMTLDEEGYEVISAKDGNKALDIIGSQSVDVLITDLKMPGMDGLKLLSEVKKVSDVPIILMTAYGTVETAVEAMKLGAQDYIVQPLI